MTILILAPAATFLMLWWRCERKRALAFYHLAEHSCKVRERIQQSSRGAA